MYSGEGDLVKEIIKMILLVIFVDILIIGLWLMYGIKGYFGLYVIYMVKNFLILIIVIK